MASEAKGNIGSSKRRRTGDSSSALGAAQSDVQPCSAPPAGLVEQLGHLAILLLDSSGDTLSHCAIALQYLQLHRNLLGLSGEQALHVGSRVLSSVAEAACASESSSLRVRVLAAAQASKMPWTPEQRQRIAEAAASAPKQPGCLPPCGMAPSAVLDSAARLLPLHTEDSSPPAPAGRDETSTSDVSHSRSQNATSVAHSRKLEVVLDLDHTLLHTTDAPRSGALPPVGIHQFRIPLPNGGESRYWMQPRGGLKEFLEQVGQIAKLHVYTMGSMSYTDQVLGVIDPTAGTFDGRILCRPDGQGEFIKSLDHLVPDESAGAASHNREACIVVDDRQEAWDKHSRKHVLQIPAFRFFSAQGLPPASTPPSDSALMDVLRVLKHVHAKWTSGESATVDRALTACRRHVLEGVQLVLSGGLLQDAEQPQRCVYWRLAETFGARCHLAWTQSANVTHVVSSGRNTSSVKKALETQGVHAVSAEWLRISCQRWSRQEEAPYTLRLSEESVQESVQRPPDAQAPASSLPLVVQEALPPGMQETLDDVAGSLPCEQD